MTDKESSNILAVNRQLHVANRKLRRDLLKFEDNIARLQGHSKALTEVNGGLAKDIMERNRTIKQLEDDNEALKHFISVGESLLSNKKTEAGTNKNRVYDLEKKIEEYINHEEFYRVALELAEETNHRIADSLVAMETDRNFYKGQFEISEEQVKRLAGRLEDICGRTKSVDDALYASAIELFGEENQITVLAEECAELIVAIHHRRRDRINYSELLKEMADVEIMLDQMRIIFGTKEYEVAKKIKLDKLKRKVNSGDSDAQ